MERIPITALVVMFNAVKLHDLDKRFKSLDFCDEIIAIDLGSSDNSVEIAKKYNCKIRYHPWVPMGELAWSKYVKEAKNKWIIIADPDEVITDNLKVEIIDTINNIDKNNENVGIINIPYRHHLYGRKVDASIWKNIVHISKIIHKNRIDLKCLVHSPFSIKPGFTYRTIQSNETESNVVLHYPAQTLKNLFSKLYRYVKLEGEMRYKNGERFSLFHPVKTISIGIKQNFKGMRISRNIMDNIKSLMLCCIFITYDFFSSVSLFLYQYKNLSRIKYIDILQIEPTRRCNMHCKHCNHDNISMSINSNGENSFNIKTDKFIEILDKYKNENYYIETIKLQGLGEPLLHPNINKLIDISKEKFPMAKIMIITNGSLLIPDGIDDVIFSLETINPIKYKELRGYDINRVLENIKYTASKQKIIINHVMTHLVDKEDTNEITEFANSLNATVWYTPMEVWSDPTKENYNECVENVKLASKIHEFEIKSFQSWCGWLTEEYIYYDYLGRRHPCCKRMTDDYISDDKLDYNVCCGNCPV